MIQKAKSISIESINSYSGIISLITLIFAIGYWFGVLDSKLERIQKNSNFISELILEQANSQDNISFNNLLPDSGILNAGKYIIVDNHLNSLSLPQGILSTTERIAKENISLDSIAITNLVIQKLVVSQEDEMNDFIANNNISRSQFVVLITDEVRRIQAE